MSRILLSAATAVIGLVASADAQPSLILDKDGVDAIRASTAEYPLFEKAKRIAMDRIDRGMAEGLIIPVPVDPGGGYTHERHKENYKLIHDAGMLYQITEDAAYSDFAETMLLAYADMYADLPLHPQQKNQAPGRLFWQSLNEANFLLYSVQGYDAIRENLSEASRERIETALLRPMAEFLSTESPQTFRKIHNHGTWAAAAVGMTGYALGDQTLVDRSIDGLDGDRSSGFLAQLDQLFSPDGYYTEGPYYQRYALMPFVLFAQAIEENEPERGIFDYRDGILLKAITSTVQQSYGGKFFPINDAIREKGLDTIELVYGVAAAYELTGDKGLLSIAEGQGVTVLTGAGLAVAKGVAEGKAKDFAYRSMVLRDGPDGEQGGLVVMRMADQVGSTDPDAQTIVAKHTGQGMGHGHFDKLAITLYDQGRELLTDYGAARFLNVPSKEGGRYLPENTTWAKQSIAHNTATVNETSHFAGDWRVAQESWPTIDYFDADADANVISAHIGDAYDGVTMARTTVQFRLEADSSPIVLDIFDVDAEQASSVDLPFYFVGQLTDDNLGLERKTGTQEALGDKDGYQHLWVEAESQPIDGHRRVTWLESGRFYTYHMVPPSGSKLNVVRIGANDPDFNLRSQQGLLLRATDQKAARFVSVFEPHGQYDPAAEFTVGSSGQIVDVNVTNAGAAALIELKTEDGETIRVGLADSANAKKRHRVRSDGRTYRWSGKYQIFRE